MRVVTGAYLLYLAAPILLLFVGSFGASWTGTLLPSGFTTGWYIEVFTDPSFQRAFKTSLIVVLWTCVLNTLIGLPLAYAIHTAAKSGVKSMARLVSLMPIAVPELVLAFGFILVFSSDTLPFLGSTWLLCRAAHPCPRRLIICGLTMSLSYLLER